MLNKRMYVFFLNVLRSKIILFPQLLVKLDWKYCRKQYSKNLPFNYHPVMIFRIQASQAFLMEH